MPADEFLNAHWNLFVKFISSLPPAALKQELEDYKLLASEDVEFRRYVNEIEWRVSYPPQAA